MSPIQIHPPARLIPGDNLGKLNPGDALWVVGTDGVDVRVLYTSTIIKVSTHGGPPSLDTDFIPQEIKLCWYLRDDPAGRPDWGRINQQSYKAPNKISKKDQ